MMIEPSCSKTEGLRFINTVEGRSERQQKIYKYRMGSELEVFSAWAWLGLSPPLYSISPPSVSTYNLSKRWRNLSLNKSAHKTDRLKATQIWISSSTANPLKFKIMMIADSPVQSSVLMVQSLSVSYGRSTSGCSVFGLNSRFICRHALPRHWTYPAILQPSALSSPCFRGQSHTIDSRFATHEWHIQYLVAILRETPTLQDLPLKENNATVISRELPTRCIFGTQPP